MALELIKLNDTTLPFIAAAIRAKTGDTALLHPSQMAEAIGGLRIIRVKSGTVQPAADHNYIDLPETKSGACAVVVRAASKDDVIAAGPGSAYGVKGVILADTNAMPNCIAHYYDGSAMKISATAPTTSKDTIQLVVNSSIKFRSSVKYVYYVMYFDAVTAVYDVSADAGSNVSLLIIKTDDGYRAEITGTGATKDYAETVEKPWGDYIGEITEIYIRSGVTSIGNYLFAATEASKKLVFEDPDGIVHLGERAFYKCGFFGKINLPALADATLSTAFEGCVNMQSLTVPQTVTAVADNAFVGCLNLCRISGLSKVKTIGACAFVYCPALVGVDVSADAIVSVGTLGFHLSSVATDFSKFSSTTFGSKSTRHIKFGEDTLKSIRAVRLKDGYIPSKNLDSQSNYPNEPFCMSNGVQLTMLESGCMAFSLYHAYNALHRDEAYSNFLEFWNAEIIAKDATITQTERNAMLSAMLSCLGWSQTTIGAETSAADKKAAISAEIAAGRPCMASIIHGVGIGSHAVLIVGCDSKADKLIVVDSGEFSGDNGVEYRIAYEDMFIGSTDSVALFNFGLMQGGSEVELV